MNIRPISSHYRWKGKVVHERECLMMIKTRSERFPKVKRRILALHSYELPEIVAIKIDRGYQPYLEWIDSSIHN